MKHLKRLLIGAVTGTLSLLFLLALLFGLRAIGAWIFEKTDVVSEWLSIVVLFFMLLVAFYFLGSNILMRLAEKEEEDEY